MTCQSCRYWKKPERERDALGECRRHPPVFDLHDLDHWGCWPRTEARDWCGEHRPNIDGPGDD